MVARLTEIRVVKETMIAGMAMKSVLKGKEIIPKSNVEFSNTLLSTEMIITVNMPLAIEAIPPSLVTLFQKKAASKAKEASPAKEEKAEKKPAAKKAAPAKKTAAKKAEDK